MLHARSKCSLSSTTAGRLLGVTQEALPEAHRRPAGGEFSVTFMPQSRSLNLLTTLPQVCGMKKKNDNSLWGAVDGIYFS